MFVEGFFVAMFSIKLALMSGCCEQLGVQFAKALCWNKQSPPNFTCCMPGVNGGNSPGNFGNPFNGNNHSIGYSISSSISSGSSVSNGIRSSFNAIPEKLWSEQCQPLWMGMGCHRGGSMCH